MCGAVLTEGEPGLPDLQVDGEVRLEAELLDGHVGAWLSLQGSVLHVAVEDAYTNTAALPSTAERQLTKTPRQMRREGRGNPCKTMCRAGDNPHIRV